MAEFLATRWDIDAEAYREALNRALALFSKKNRDYGGSWRLMRVTSLIDRMKTKLARVDQLESSTAAVLEAQQETALDMINEAVFLYIALVLRDGDGTKTLEQLAQERQRQINYLQKQVETHMITVQDAAKALSDYDKCHPGAVDAWDTWAYAEESPTNVHVAVTNNTPWVNPPLGGGTPTITLPEPAPAPSPSSNGNNGSSGTGSRPAPTASATKTHGAGATTQQRPGTGQTNPVPVPGVGDRG